LMNIPKCLAHLPKWGSHPVPFTVYWNQGKPDFRVVDPEKTERCILEKLCGICGKTLGEYSYFIGGEKCVKSHFFVDAPMHKPCAEFSAKTCPFLTGDRDYSKRETPAATQVIPEMGDARPSKMFMLAARTKETKYLKSDQGTLIFRAGRWTKQVQI